jgi:hypothetical protein
VRVVLADAPRELGMINPNTSRARLLVGLSDLVPTFQRRRWVDETFSTLHFVVPVLIRRPEFAGSGRIGAAKEERQL